jgi:hypothetical protein
LGLPDNRRITSGQERIMYKTGRHNKLIEHINVVTQKSFLPRFLLQSGRTFGLRPDPIKITFRALNEPLFAQDFYCPTMGDINRYLVENNVQ